MKIKLHLKVLCLKVIVLKSKFVIAGSLANKIDQKTFS